MPPPSKKHKPDTYSKSTTAKAKLHRSNKELRANKTQMDELKFDEDARQDYLTGFHKRKVQRIKHAQEQAAKMAKEEAVVNRRELREERKRDLERHVNEVNTLLRQNNPDISDDEEEHLEDGEDGEWGGVPEAATSEIIPPVDGVDEYVDEDKYTTVTIETMDADPRKWDAEEEEVTVVKEGEGEEGEGGDSKKRVWTKEKPKKTLAEIKKKRQKFRYETKFERQQTRGKQRAKNRAAADARKKAKE